LYGKQNGSNDITVKSFSAGDKILIQDHQPTHVKIQYKISISKGHLSQVNMLRTNQTFLNYLDELYGKQNGSNDITVKSFSAGDKILIQDHQPTHV
ncbi:hypothetical protein BOQ60_24615, partial [Chryseobacterium sp. CH1]